MTAHPYSNLPERAFWKPAVAARHVQDLQDLTRVHVPARDASIATAGSCFAQHIGRHLRRHGAQFLDLEPAPPFLATSDARAHGYGVYSCRYGNVYTTKQLLQLAREAIGERTPEERVWTKNGRFFDALRPSVDPVGHESVDDVLAMRTHHLQRVRELLERVDVFVFTLGLTEAWEATSDGTVYPTAPGTIAGTFDATRYRFRNYRYPEVMEDLRGFWDILRGIRPHARMVLTVSPVPLTATASDDHVLVATTQSKATLRAVAGDLAFAEPAVDYFPSYEIITSHSSRAAFFEPDLRTVNESGVALVMSHFFREDAPREATPTRAPEAETAELVCDEDELNRFAPPTR